MMKKIISLFVLVCWIGIGGKSSPAQQPGARGLVFQGSFVAVANDYSTTFWNPAGLMLLKNTVIGAMVHSLPFDRNAGFASVIFILGKDDRLGINWSGLMMNNIEARLGNTAEPDYYFDSSEQLVGLSYARKLNGHLAVGLNSKLLISHIDNIAATGYGFDAGLLYLINREFRIGVMAHNLYSQLHWQSNHVEKLNLIGNLAGSYFGNNIIAALGLQAVESGDILIAAGVELKVTDPIKLRMGVRKNQMSVGLGFDFSLDNVKIDCGYSLATCKMTTDLSHLCEIVIMLQDPAKQLGKGKVLDTDKKKPELEVKNKQNYPTPKTQSEEHKPVDIIAKKKVEPEAKERMIIIIATSLLVRMGPGTTYIPLGQVDNGQVFPLQEIQASGRWYKIIFEGKDGWVDARYARVIKW